jgi:hypothetical protein
VACATGSQRKPGSFRFIHVDPPFIETILPPPLAWLKPFLPFVKPFDIDTDQLCALGPPDWPAFDALQLAALLSGNPYAEAAAAGASVIQLVANILWQLQCQCTPPEVTPPLNPAPGAPVDVPVINPPSIVTQPNDGIACLVDYPVSYTSPALGVPTGGDYAQISYGSQDVRRIRALTNHVVSGSTHPQMTADIAWFAPGPILISRSPMVNIPPGQHAAFDFPVLPGSNKADLEIFTNSTSTDLVGGALEAFCGPGGAQPCCSGTDPRLLALLTRVDNLTTLMQRYSLPFASVPGVQHTALSGKGSFAVNDLLGLRLDVTAHTSSRPDLEGNPAYVWDQGWVSIVTGEGMIDEKRVSQTHLQWTPRLMQLAITVGYDFRPGTVVTITELKPEP